MPRPRLSLSAYADGVLANDRVVLSQAITLVESRLPEDQALAQGLLQSLLLHSRKSLRVGITGVPGVGKSTFIEALGLLLNSRNHKVAILTVDPSSQKTGGSILGDKTRMPRLSQEPLTYIRPSAAGSTIGGVAQRTKETLLLCEAAGYEIVIVETVGVGQSETVVHSITDFFLLLMLAGAGDELQGLKKGVTEMADALVINKADGNNQTAAKRAQREYQNALHLFPPSESQVPPQVFTCSALHEEGIAAIWQFVEQYQQTTLANGYFYHNRQQQELQWMHRLIQDYRNQHFYTHPAIKQHLPQIEKELKESKITARQGADTLIGLALP